MDRPAATTQPSRAHVVVRDVHKAYGPVRALGGVSFEAEAGVVTAVLGRNGAGKTTLLSLVAGLLGPDRGQVEVLGHDVVDQPVLARRELGFAPQELGLYPTATVQENLEFFGVLHGVRGRELPRRVEAVAAVMDLTRLLARLARRLSSGEQRRLHVAMALLHRPSVLLLDEPTAGVDAPARQAILAHVRQLADEGVAVIYSTHYFAELAPLDARVLVLHQGKVVAAGTTAELTERHGSERLTVSFDGPVPDPPPPGWIRRGDTLLSPTDGPLRVTAALSQLGSDADRVREVARTRPGLESMFLTLTASTDEEIDDDVVEI